MVKRTLFRKKYCRTKPKQFFRRCDYLRKITDKARQSLRVVDIEASPSSGCVCYYHYQAVYDLCSFSVYVISIYLLLNVCGLDAIQLSNLQ